MKYEKQSFTLIEILVVIVIIGILSSFIFFTINDSVEKAQIAKSKMFSESIRNNLLLNLVSEWKFDDSSDLGIDSWGSNNGTNHGADPVSADCISGGCASYNETDYIDFGNNTNLKNITNSITVSYWVYVNSRPPESYALLISKGYGVSSGNSWSAGLSKYGNGYFFIRNGENTAYSYPEIGGWTSIPNQKWTYMVHVFDGFISYGATYQNGELDKERLDMPYSTIYISTQNIKIGGRSGSTAGYFNGSIDEVQIYDTAISEAQIKH